jgi:hypothetical protein
MSVSILVVDDETDVAALFRQHFRCEARQGTSRQLRPNQQGDFRYSHEPITIADQTPR